MNLLSIVLTFLFAWGAHVYGAFLSLSIGGNYGSASVSDLELPSLTVSVSNLNGVAIVTLFSDYSHVVLQNCTLVFVGSQSIDVPFYVARRNIDVMETSLQDVVRGLLYTPSSPDCYTMTSSISITSSLKSIGCFSSGLPTITNIKNSTYRLPTSWNGYYYFFNSPYTAIIAQLSPCDSKTVCNRGVTVEDKQTGKFARLTADSFAPQGSLAFQSSTESSATFALADGSYLSVDLLSVGSDTFISLNMILPGVYTSPQWYESVTGFCASFNGTDIQSMQQSFITNSWSGDRITTPRLSYQTCSLTGEYPVVSCPSPSSQSTVVSNGSTAQRSGLSIRAGQAFTLLSIMIPKDVMSNRGLILSDPNNFLPITIGLSWTPQNPISVYLSSSYVNYPNCIMQVVTSNDNTFQVTPNGFSFASGSTSYVQVTVIEQGTCNKASSNIEYLVSVPDPKQCLVVGDPHVTRFDGSTFTTSGSPIVLVQIPQQVNNIGAMSVTAIVNSRNVIASLTVTYNSQSITIRKGYLTNDINNPCPSGLSCQFVPNRLYPGATVSLDKYFSVWISDEQYLLNSYIAITYRMFGVQASGVCVGPGPGTIGTAIPIPQISGCSPTIPSSCDVTPVCTPGTQTPCSGNGCTGNYYYGNPPSCSPCAQGTVPNNDHTSCGPCSDTSVITAVPNSASICAPCAPGARANSNNVCVCPTGSHFNSNNECVCDDTTLIFNSGNRRCECPPGKTMTGIAPNQGCCPIITGINSGEVPTAWNSRENNCTCPVFTSMSNGHCCFDRRYWDGTRCTPLTGCSNGQSCSPSTSCSPSQPCGPPQCPAGQACPVPSPPTPTPPTPTPPTPSCPPSSGMIYDSTTNRCECTGGLVRSNDHCCPPSMSWDSNIQLCLCPSGQGSTDDRTCTPCAAGYSSQNNRCICSGPNCNNPPPTPSCTPGSGMIYNSATNGCECTNGLVQSNNHCCPSSMSWDSTYQRCLCPPGQFTTDNTTCTPCAAGMTTINNHCICNSPTCNFSPPACPPSSGMTYIPSLGRCDCTGGLVNSNGHCCPQGKIWDATSNSCLCADGATTPDCSCPSPMVIQTGQTTCSCPVGMSPSGSTCICADTTKVLVPGSPPSCQSCPSGIPNADRTACVPPPPTCTDSIMNRPSCTCPDSRMVVVGGTCTCPNNMVIDYATRTCKCPSIMVIGQPNNNFCVCPAGMNQVGSQSCQCQPNWTLTPSGTCQPPCCIDSQSLSCQGNCCRPGYIFQGGSCVPCQPGTYSSSQSSSQCTPCPSTQIAPFYASSQCYPCGPGQQAQNRVECVPTPPPVTPPPGCCRNSTTRTCSGNCCQPGFYYFDNTCYPCPLGTYSNTAQATQCTPCQKGTYANSTGLTNCYPCDSGMFNSIIGSQGCSPCPAGQVTSDGITCRTVPPPPFNPPANPSSITSMTSSAIAPTPSSSPSSTTTTTFIITSTFSPLSSSWVTSSSFTSGTSTATTVLPSISSSSSKMSTSAATSSMPSSSVSTSFSTTPGTATSSTSSSTMPSNSVPTSVISSTPAIASSTVSQTISMSSISTNSQISTISSSSGTQSSGTLPRTSGTTGNQSATSSSPTGTPSASFGTSSSSQFSTSTPNQSSSSTGSSSFWSTSTLTTNTIPTQYQPPATPTTSKSYGTWSQSQSTTNSPPPSTTTPRFTTSTSVSICIPRNYTSTVAITTVTSFSTAPVIVQTPSGPDFTSLTATMTQVCASSPSPPSPDYSSPSGQYVCVYRKSGHVNAPIPSFGMLRMAGNSTLGLKSNIGNGANNSTSSGKVVERLSIVMALPLGVFLL